MIALVCVKQVPDTETQIRLKRDVGIETQNIKWILNPYDEYAVEEALKMKEGGHVKQVILITLGPKARTVDALRTGLAMGADEALCIDTDMPLGSRQTAQAIAKAIKHYQWQPVDFILTGKAAIDDNMGVFGPMLAGILNWPFATHVLSVTPEGDEVALVKELDGGAKQTLKIPKPCVLTATKGLNMPRYIRLPGIMKAKKKPLHTITLDELDPELGKNSDYAVENYTLPPQKQNVEMIEGDSSVQVKTLLKKLKEEAKVL